MPITGYYFYQDDFLFLYRIVNEPWPEFLLAPHGGHLLIARNAIFWLFHTLFATAAGWYFCVVLLTHLLNVYLLFAVIRAHTGSAPLACFGAALWGTCVVNEGALGWYSVYGQVLVATAMLWILQQLTAIAAGAALPRFASARWSLLLLFAATCFGIGVAVALVAPLLAWLLLPSTPARATAVRHLAVAAVITVLVYAGVSQLHASLYGGANSLPSLLAALQRPDLVGGFTTLLALCGVTDLVLGVFAPALAHPYPTIALVGTPILLAGVAAILLYAPAARARIAADFALILACYGSIALGRALLVDGPLVFGAVEPRYQYAALVPVTLLLCEILRPAAALLGRAQTPVGVAAGFATLLLVFGRPHDPLYPTQTIRRDTKNVLQRIRLLARDQPGDGPACIRNGDFSGAGMYVGRVRPEFPGWAALYAIFDGSETIDGRRIYFVERNPEAVAAAAGGRRSAHLIIGPERSTALGCLDPFLERMKRASPP